MTSKGMQDTKSAKNQPVKYLTGEKERFTIISNRLPNTR
jgi:hypothetical protein